MYTAPRLYFLSNNWICWKWFSISLFLGAKIQICHLKTFQQKFNFAPKMDQIPFLWKTYMSRIIISTCRWIPSQISIWVVTKKNRLRTAALLRNTPQVFGIPRPGENRPIPFSALNTRRVFLKLLLLSSCLNSCQSPVKRRSCNKSRVIPHSVWKSH